MSKQEIVVGLDLGTTKICAAVGKLSESGEVELIGIGTSPSNGLRKGVVINIDQTVDSIKKAVKEAMQISGCTIHNVTVGIAGNHIQGFNSHGVVAITGNEVTQRVIDRALDAAKAVAIPPDRRLIHTLPQEFIVDDQRGITHPIGMSGVRLEVKVHIVTGAVTSAENIHRSCVKSGLDVDDIILESLASAKAVLTDDEREIGVALVDLGGGTCDIAIIANDAVKFTSVIGLGGQNLTSDISIVMGTPVAQAEKIKVQYGCAMASMVLPNEEIDVPSTGGREPRRLQRQLLAEICESRMEEILTLIDQELERSGYKKNIGAGVVLTGGGAMLQGTRELGESIFSLPTRIGYPHSVMGIKDMVNSPKYATVVGLLRSAVENETASNRRSGDDEESGIFTKISNWMKSWFKTAF